MRFRDFGGDKEVETLISLMAKLPGLGPRSARRAVIKMIEKRKIILEPLSQVLSTVAERVTECLKCGNFSTEEICSICSDNERTKNVICIVQDVADLWAMERSNVFKGTYHVLGNYSSTYSGINPEELKVEKIKSRLKMENVEEVILALDATINGQTTAHYLIETLQDTGVKFSSLAHGVPVGGELDYLDDGTIRAAFTARKKI
ncbi:MAG: recombination mediator RecR [Pseudomonadota bacterium]|nr:recombination mediator RecR [Pseudomonadota bacterium]